MDINLYTDACTHSKQGVGSEMSWLGHKHTAMQGHSTWHQSMHRGCTRWGHSGVHKYMYWCMYTFETRCGNRNVVTGTSNTLIYRGITDFHQTMHADLEPDMGSQVHLNACTNACTHSKQGVETQIRWLGHKHTGYTEDTQVSIKLCIQGGADMGSQDGPKSMYWCMYTL